jgi:putative membrane protein
MDADSNIADGFWRSYRPPSRLPSPSGANSGNGWKLGLLFSTVGLLTVLLSTKHYFGVRQDIDYDTYEPTDRWVILFSLAIAILGAGVIYYMFTIPSSLEGLMAPE